MAAQAIAAAARTVSGRRLHSLHVAFLRPGNPNAPLHYGVAVLREGRTFSTRRVSVSQDGVTVMEALVSFLEPIDGDDFQRPMPASPIPTRCPTSRTHCRPIWRRRADEYLAWCGCAWSRCATSTRRHGSPWTAALPTMRCAGCGFDSSTATHDDEASGCC